MLEAFKLVKRVAHRKELAPKFIEASKLDSPESLHRISLPLRSLASALQQITSSSEVRRNSDQQYTRYLPNRGTALIDLQVHESSARAVLEVFRERVMRVLCLLVGEGYSQGNNLELQRLLSYALWPAEERCIDTKFIKFLRVMKMGKACFKPDADGGYHRKVLHSKVLQHWEILPTAGELAVRCFR